MQATIRLRRRVLSILAMLGLLVAGGSLGYVLIEGWPWLDALYMTLITISTVGFGEVQLLSPAGRALTAVLILFGVSVAAYSFSASLEKKSGTGHILLSGTAHWLQPVAGGQIDLVP